MGKLGDLALVVVGAVGGNATQALTKGLLKKKKKPGTGDAK
jgi:hypothetical protein